MKAFRLCACLLNISEARDGKIVEAVASSALRINDHTHVHKTDETSHIKSSVLNIFSDYDYNRSVITIVAAPENIGRSVTDACTTAYELIDLSTHKGGHPRLGSVDLVPIHPLSVHVSLEECGSIAKDIANELTQKVPGMAAFLFGHADFPLRRGLVQRRKELGWYGGSYQSSYEGMMQDVGSTPTQRYGLTGIGAIPYVTNCNVTIDTQDVKFGREVAASLRGSNPTGLPGVQAMAFAHEAKVEVACNVEGLNMEDHESQLTQEQKKTLVCSFGSYYQVPPHVIEDRVRELARACNIEIIGTALVGFTPYEAHELAIQALTSGQAEFWKTRKIRAM